MITTVDIPQEIMDRIREFLAAGKTGNVTLDMKDGRVLAWKITEHGRVCNVDKEY